MVEKHLSSNRTNKNEIRETYKNVLFMSPMVDRRYYDSQSWAAFMWIKYFGVTVNFPYVISPLSTYINDAILGGLYFEARAMLESKGLGAADYRQMSKPSICGETGNLTYNLVQERPRCIIS